MLLNEAEKYEEQINALKDQSDTLIVESEVEGIVKEINVGLKNPLITISSVVPVIKGDLTEEERNKITEGMKVNIYSDIKKGKMTGSIEQISPLPADGPKVEGKSLYPFTVKLEEGEETELYSGNACQFISYF